MTEYVKEPVGEYLVISRDNRWNVMERFGDYRMLRKTHARRRPLRDRLAQEMNDRLNRQDDWSCSVHCGAMTGLVTRAVRIVERVDSGPDCRLCWAILFDDNWQSLARTDELELVL